MTTELPADLTAEQNLIGLTLIKRRIPEPARDISTADFHSGINRGIWAAFSEMDCDGREIEPFGAYEIFKRDNRALAQNFTVSDLSNFTVGMIPANESAYVRKIKTTAQSRFLIRELFAQIENLQKGGVSISNLKRKLDDLEISTESKGSFKPLSEILKTQVAPALADLKEGITHRISTGFENIDNVIGGGLSLSDVLVVAALTSAGKSAFVLQLAVNIAKKGVPVAFLSGEMSDRENGLRVLSQSAKFFNLNSATRINDDEFDFLSKWVNHEPFQKLPIYFDSKTSDLQTVSRSLRHLVESVGVKVLVIDYIQLFKLNRYDRQTRTERIAEASQEVKRIAMEYGLAVIEVVQFNREGAKSLKTSIHDLEGSSQLEKDASLIFIIDRDNDSSEVTLRIVKGRNVGKCELKGRFTGMTLNFEF